MEAGELVPVGPGQAFLWADVETGDGWRYYVDQGLLLALPPKPSEFHDFDYAVKQWVVAVPSTEAWRQVRDQRNKLLADTDWMVVRAVDRGEPMPAEWQAYRQTLRDITNQPDPFNIVWPTPPA